MRKLLTLSVACLLMFGSAELQAAPKNVLFYGNSFTLGFGSTKSVNALFEEIAIAAGQEAPLVQSAAASGQSIGWHLDNNFQAIFTLIPPDRDWDFIVMQEHSTKLTRAFNTYPQSIEESKLDVVGLYDRATQRSADVVPVLYETWARGPGHSFYSGAPPLFTDPAEMQAEVRDGYDMLKQAIDDSVGSDLALIAPVGDAWEIANYDRLHANDLWHAQNRGTLLAALTIYATVYGDDTSDIDLSSVLAGLGLSADDGVALTAAADAAVIPEPTCVAMLIAGLAICSSLRVR